MAAATTLTTATTSFDKDDNPLKKTIEYLESETNLLTNFTNFWKSLYTHFSSLEQSLKQRSDSLDTNLHTLRSSSDLALSSLSARESSVPARESAASENVARIKQSLLSEIGKQSSPHESKNRKDDVSSILRFHCRRMDSEGLCRYLLYRKDMMTLRTELGPAIYEESVDPMTFVLQAFEDLVNRKTSSSSNCNVGEKDGGNARKLGENENKVIGLSDLKWGCGWLLRVLTSEEGVASRVKERAWVLAERWKEMIDDAIAEDCNDAKQSANASEVALFLQLLVTYKIVDKFELDVLKAFVMDFASRRDMPKIAVSLGFGEKMADIIEELIANGKEVDAVYFAFECDMTKRFPPVPLLKAHLKQTRKSANDGARNGSADEANLAELNALRAILKCIEDHKLESEFSTESLKKRLAQLEKAKLDKKKLAGQAKSQNKRSRTSGGSAGSASFPPAKAGRLGNAYPSMWSGHNLSVHQMSTSYAPAYSSYDHPYLQDRSIGSRSPAAQAQQHYPLRQQDAGVVRPAAVSASSYTAPPPAVTYSSYEYPAGYLPSSYLH